METGDRAQPSSVCDALLVILRKENGDTNKSSCLSVSIMNWKVHVGVQVNSISWDAPQQCEVTVNWDPLLKIN